MNASSPMRYALASHRAAAGVRPAIVIHERIYDLAAVLDATHQPADSLLRQSGVAALLDRWESVRSGLGAVASEAAASISRGQFPVQAIAATALAAPFIPSRVFCAASNFIEHANEMGTALAAKADSKPYMFLKTASSVIGPHDTVRIPRETQKPDWEVELAAVIGRRARRITVSEALGHVAGYMVLNDVSARDLTRRSDYPFKHDWFQGKNHDTFCPIGPWMVPAEFIPDPQNVHLNLTVNGESMQDGTTAEMIWSVAEQIAYLSTIVTLSPGDVVATGTPTGVGMGRGVFLKAGDVMEATIAGIGKIRNPVEDES